MLLLCGCHSPRLLAGVVEKYRQLTRREIEIERRPTVDHSDVAFLYIIS
jgi:hypothetical protein